MHRVRHLLALKWIRGVEIEAVTGLRDGRLCTSPKGALRRRVSARVPQTVRGLALPSGIAEVGGSIPSTRHFFFGETMKTYNVRYTREFTTQVKADSIAIAEPLARLVLAKLHEPTARLLYILEEGVQISEPDGTPTPPRPFGRPNGGGSPGTPIVWQETLAEQIAKVA